MYLRIKDNLWTRIEWWDQLAKAEYSVVLKKIDEDEKSELILSITGNRRSQEKLMELLDEVHMAVINNFKFFDVQSWFTRSKNRKKTADNSEK